MRKLVATVFLASIVLSAGSAFAAEIGEVEFDGKLEYVYRWEENHNNPMWVNGGTNNFKIVLNAKTGVVKNLDFYTRFAAQHVGTPWLGADFYDDTANGKHSASGIDHFGFIYKNAGWTYQLGRQDAYIGGLSGLYSSIYFVGPKASVDGIRITGKSGIVDIDAHAFQERYSYLDNGNRVYALHASYSPSKPWVLGATIGKYEDRNHARTQSTSTNNWAVNVAYTTGKASLFGEYAQSDATTENKTWAVGTSYAPDEKNTFNVIHYDGGINGDMGGWDMNSPYQPGGGGFEPSFKGMYYVYDHKFDKNITGTIFWRDMKSRTPNSEGNFHTNKNLRVILTYAF